jgi:hypothetical protein
VGGILLILFVIIASSLFYRHRYRGTRFRFGDDDGIDGGVVPLGPPEEDMPPPDYQRVFPAGSSEEARLQAENAGLRTSNAELSFGTRLLPGRRKRAAAAVAAAQAATRAIPPAQQSRDAHAFLPLLSQSAVPSVQMTGVDSAPLAWKGVRPMKEHPLVPADDRMGKD